jgi:signal transduction histidine kinase
MSLRRSLLRQAVILPAIWGFPVLLGAQQDSAGPLRLQYGVTVSAESLFVGDPFRVVIRVRAPEGATITFPPGPDTTGAVQPLDAPAVEVLDDTSAFVDESATYRLAAWDVGMLSIPLGELRVNVGMTERRISVPPQRIFVRSVLPEDSTLRAPKPQRDIYQTMAPPLWPWYLLAAAVAAALLLWWWLRRRRGGEGDRAAESPYVEAQRHFARIEGLRLIAAGERGRHVALMADVVRRYLARRVPRAGLPMTTSELTAALRHEGRVPVAALAALLEEVDLVKFARRPISAERAAALGDAARELVQRTEDAMRASEEAEAERAAAGRKAA